MAEFILWFGGGAIAYGVAVTLIAMLLMRLARGDVIWTSVPLIFCVATFVFLTQHPFPKPNELICPLPSAAPNWQTLRFLLTLRGLYEVGTPLEGWLNNRLFMATTMNFVVCWVIGLTWALSRKSWRTAGLFGFGLSLACELTQLTGIWGLYPCAYRSFNVDDLLLNTLGVTFGAMAFVCLAALLHKWREGFPV